MALRIFRASTRALTTLSCGRRENCHFFWPRHIFDGSGTLPLRYIYGYVRYTFLQRQVRSRRNQIAAQFYRFQKSAIQPFD